MRRRWFFLVIVAMILTGGIVATGANAKDAKGCEGLSDYRAEMFVAGRDYLKELRSDVVNYDEREASSFSTDDWTAIADDLLQFQRDLKEIDAPDWAQPWHDVQIERLGGAEMLSRTIVTSGILVAAGMIEDLDAIDVRLDAARDEIGKTCGDFIGFVADWDALDGKNRDGTPVATPTS